MYTVYHYDAFSDVPTKGNPAGIVFQATGLTDEQMQAIAKQVGFNECAFVCTPQRADADMRLRFFTPGSEIALSSIHPFCLETYDPLAQMQQNGKYSLH